VGNRHAPATGVSPAAAIIAAMGSRILIVEDEPDLARLLEINLTREGYRAEVVDSAGGALSSIEGDPPAALLLLDLMLPDLSGLEVLRRIRANPRHQAIPVIAVTAQDQEIDRVVAFEVGVDDYVVKPFSVRELMMRIRAVLRRSGPATPPPPEPRHASSGRVVIDAEAHQAWADGRPVALTAAEMRLLAVLLARKGRALTRAQLLAETVDDEPDVTERAIDTQVKRLRQKLGDAGSCIETVRGVGYRLRDG
jgi:two-component system phosphate regulon response regulator PhoB